MPTAAGEPNAGEETPGEMGGGEEGGRGRVPGTGAENRVDLMENW